MDPAYLQSARATSVSGVYFRHIPAGGDPLFSPEHPAGGRWQRGEVVEGFYLAGSEQAAWSEWYRALAELAIPPMRQMPRDLWRFEGSIDGVADLSDVDKLNEVGLPLPVPARSQWPRFQEVGEGLWKAGWPSILYPAASRAANAEGAKAEGDLALCLFRQTTEMPGVAPFAPPVRHNEPPAPPPNLRT